jgi:hypothetical protein
MNLLLGLCFCDACRDQARHTGIAIDPYGAVRAVHHYQTSAATVADDVAAH